MLFLKKKKHVTHVYVTVVGYFFDSLDVTLLTGGQKNNLQFFYLPSVFCRGDWYC